MKNSTLAAKPQMNEEPISVAPKLNRLESLYARFRKWLTAQKLFFYRNEAQRFDSEAHLKKSVDRNYYFRNF